MWEVVVEMFPLSILLCTNATRFIAKTKTLWSSWE